MPIATPFESMHGAVVDLAVIGLYLMVRSPKPVAVGVFVLPLVLGLVVVAGTSAPRESDWPTGGARPRSGGRCTGIFLLGGGGSYVRGVLRRADVPGAGMHGSRTSGQPASGSRCRAWSSPSGSTGGRSRWPSPC